MGEHSQSIHSGQNDIKTESDINFLECPTCGMKTRGEEEMRQHIRNVHINPMNGWPPNKNLLNAPSENMNPMYGSPQNRTNINGPPSHTYSLNGSPKNGNTMNDSLQNMNPMHGSPQNRNPVFGATPNLNQMNGSPPNMNQSNGAAHHMNHMNDIPRNMAAPNEPQMNVNPMNDLSMQMNPMNDAPMQNSQMNPAPKRRSRNNAGRGSQMEEFGHDPSDGKEMFNCKEYIGEGTPCTFQTAYRLNLKRHITIVHEKIKDFICQIPLCDFRTAQSGNLKRHLQTVHKGHPEIEEAIKNVPPQNYFKNMRSENIPVGQDRHDNISQEQMQPNPMPTPNQGQNMVFCNMCNFSTDNTFILHRHREENHQNSSYGPVPILNHEIKTEIKPEPDYQGEYSQNMNPHTMPMEQSGMNQP